LARIQQETHGVLSPKSQREGFLYTISLGK